MTATDDARIVWDSLTGSHAGRTTQGLDALERLVARVEQAERERDDARGFCLAADADAKEAEARNAALTEALKAECFDDLSVPCDCDEDATCLAHRVLAALATAADRPEGTTPPANTSLVPAEFEQALRDRGAPVRCCGYWPECSHMLAWYEERVRPEGTTPCSLAAADRPEGTTPTDHKEDA